MKTMTREQVIIMDDVVKMGGKVWDRGNMSRTYITCDILNTLDKEQGGQGDYNLNSQNNKLFLDNLTGKVMRSYKNKKAKVELNLN
jgi:calcineurin-like phosphoesterase